VKRITRKKRGGFIWKRKFVGGIQDGGRVRDTRKKGRWAGKPGKKTQTGGRRRGRGGLRKSSGEMRNTHEHNPQSGMESKRHHGLKKKPHKRTAP